MLENRRNLSLSLQTNIIIFCGCSEYFSLNVVRAQTFFSYNIKIPVYVNNNFSLIGMLIVVQVLTGDEKAEMNK